MPLVLVHADDAQCRERDVVGPMRRAGREDALFLLRATRRCDQRPPPGVEVHVADDPAVLEARNCPRRGERVSSRLAWSAVASGLWVAARSLLVRGSSPVRLTAAECESAHVRREHDLALLQLATGDLLVHRRLPRRSEALLVGRRDPADGSHLNRSAVLCKLRRVVQGWPEGSWIDAAARRGGPCCSPGCEPSQRWRDEQHARAAQRQKAEDGDFATSFSVDISRGGGSGVCALRPTVLDRACLHFQQRWRQAGALC